MGMILIPEARVGTIRFDFSQPSWLSHTGARNVIGAM